MPSESSGGLLPSAFRSGCVAEALRMNVTLRLIGGTDHLGHLVIGRLFGWAGPMGVYEESDEKSVCIIWRSGFRWHYVVELSRKTPPKEPFSLPPPPTSVGGLSFCTVWPEGLGIGARTAPVATQRQRFKPSEAAPRNDGNLQSCGLPTDSLPLRILIPSSI